MRILVLEQRYTNSNEAGIGRFNVFSQIWAENGHKIDILAGMINYLTGKKPDKYKRKFLIKEKEGENIRIFRVFDSGLGYRTFWGRLFSYFTFLKSTLMIGLFIARPNVIIASSPPIFIGALGWYLAMIKKSKFIFEVRDLWPDEAIELGFLKNRVLIRLSLCLEKFIYNHSDLVAVNSPKIKEYLIEKKSVPETKIINIPNPVNMDLFNNVSGDKIREKFGWKNRFIILYSGSMSAVYDFDLILDIAKELRHLPMFFVFIGDGRQKPILIKRVKREKIKNVQFLEPVNKNEIGNFIKAADIGIASLKKDVLLLNYIYASKIFDYLACGKPMIIAMTGASADLLCHKAKAGLCVFPGDKNGFKKAILRLYKNQNQKEQLGKQGLKYLKDHFQAQELAKNYLKAIQT